MKIQIDINKKPLDITLSTVAFALGAYSMYKRMQTQYDDGIDFGQRPPLWKAFLGSIPFSMANAALWALTWKFSMRSNILSTSFGIGVLSAAYTFPAAVITFGNLDSWRLNDDTEGLSKAIISTLSVATAATLVASNEVRLNEDGPMALAVTTTLPAALTFFNYKARNSAESEDSVAEKAAAAAIMAGALVSTVNSLRPMLNN